MAALKFKQQISRILFLHFSQAHMPLPFGLPSILRRPMQLLHIKIVQAFKTFVPLHLRVAVLVAVLAEVYLRVVFICNSFFT